MNDRKRLNVLGVFIGTYERRVTMETEPGALYYDFRPDWGIDILMGELTISFESGTVDVNGMVQSRKILDIIREKQNAR